MGLSTRGISYTENPTVVLGSVITVTNGVSDPYQITSSEFGALFINTGATEKAYIDLPDMQDGIILGFYVSNAHGIRITAKTGDVIRQYSEVTASGGYIESNLVGAIIYLQAVGSEWVTKSGIGVWA